MIAVADIIKKDSAQAVKELQHMGIKVIMLTGDNQRTARRRREKKQALTASLQASFLTGKRLLSKTCRNGEGRLW